MTDTGGYLYFATAFPWHPGLNSLGSHPAEWPQELSQQLDAMSTLALVYRAQLRGRGWHISSVFGYWRSASD